MTSIEGRLRLERRGVHGPSGTSFNRVASICMSPKKVDSAGLECDAHLCIFVPGQSMFCTITCCICAIDCSRLSGMTLQVISTLRLMPNLSFDADF